MATVMLETTIFQDGVLHDLGVRLRKVPARIVPTPAWGGDTYNILEIVLQDDTHGIHYVCITPGGIATRYVPNFDGEFDESVLVKDEDGMFWKPVDLEEAE